MAYLRNSLILMAKSIFHYAQKMRPFNLYRLSEKKDFDKKMRYAFLILGQRYINLIRMIGMGQFRWEIISVKTRDPKWKVYSFYRIYY